MDAAIQQEGSINRLRYGHSHPIKRVIHTVMINQNDLAAWILLDKTQGIVLHLDLNKYKFKHVNMWAEVEHVRKTPNY